MVLPLGWVLEDVEFFVMDRGYLNEVVKRGDRESVEYCPRFGGASPGTNPCCFTDIGREYKIFNKSHNCGEYETVAVAANLFDGDFHWKRLLPRDCLFDDLVGCVIVGGEFPLRLWPDDE